MTQGKISREQAETRVAEFLNSLKQAGWTVMVSAAGNFRVQPKRTRAVARN